MRELLFGSLGQVSIDQFRSSIAVWSYPHQQLAIELERDAVLTREHAIVIDHVLDQAAAVIARIADQFQHSKPRRA